MKGLILGAAIAATASCASADSFGVPLIGTGDVNGNGIIDSVDSLLQNNRGGGIIPSTPGQLVHPRTQYNSINPQGNYFPQTGVQTYGDNIGNPYPLDPYPLDPYQLGSPFPSITDGIPNLQGTVTGKINCTLGGYIYPSCNANNLPKNGILYPVDAYGNTTYGVIDCTTLGVEAALMNTLQPLFHIPVVTFAQPTGDGGCEYAIQ